LRSFVGEFDLPALFTEANGQLTDISVINVMVTMPTPGAYVKGLRAAIGAWVP
jgi:hypothetical protein